MKVRSLDDIKSFFKQPFTGTCETSASPFWRLIRHYSPTCKIVTVRRPIDDVLRSLENIGFVLTNEFVRSIKNYDRKLDQIESRISDVIRIDFDELNSENKMKNLTEILLSIPFDSSRYQTYQKMNLQVNVLAQLRYYDAYKPQISKLASIAKATMISHMQSHDKIDDGVVIKEESLASVLKDGKSLITDHLLDVGEAPEGLDEKNIPLMEAVEQMGALQIHTARMNGRLFGYLFTIIGPSFERQDSKSGVHCAFYTSKDVRNIGIRLQRASIESLKQKGCSEVMLRAGVRGSTAGRISTLYKRMGAEYFGDLYRVNLEA